MPVIRHNTIPKQRELESPNGFGEQKDECSIIIVVEEKRRPRVSAIDDMVTVAMLMPSEGSSHALVRAIAMPEEFQGRSLRRFSLCVR